MRPPVSPRRPAGQRVRAGIAALAVAACASAARAQGEGEPDGEARIRVVYEPPRKAAHAAAQAALRRERVLERVGALVGLFRLPTRLTYRLKDCAGELNAWYAPETRTVTVCYELIDSIARAPQTGILSGVTRRDALAGPVAQILLHESSHAIFDLLDVPILGREEDAADQMAAFVLLQLGGSEARRVVNGSAFFFATLAKDEPVDKGAFSDTHGLSWQRFYNLACLAYGSDARAFRYILDRGYLPKDRAEGCGEEYEQVAFAFRKLIGPHLRVRLEARERLQRVFWRSWSRG
ncbi:DUF4344 domain-containing metallopeptidase [Methylobacterium nigriterrae]|uniref:DUF4344 domain-containing metallopeptidase n=1 Tax=Methylobacterium nigriterrae TaxID=3127512 RepID=UPI003013A18B